MNTFKRNQSVALVSKDTGKATHITTIAAVNKTTVRLASVPTYQWDGRTVSDASHR